MNLRPARASPWVFATILLLLGVALAGGGLQLLLLGGSHYYLLIGLALIVCGVLLWSGRRAGIWVYVLILAYTLVWSLVEIGLDGWSLASRLGLLVLLGLYLLLPHTRRGLV